MNEQRSSLAGVCIQQQSSEQRSLIIDQQSRNTSSTSGGSIALSTISQTSRYTAAAGTVVRGSGMSGGVASQPPQLHRPLLANGVPYSSYSLLKDEVGRGNCVCLPSSASSVAPEERPCPTSLPLASPMPSTSTAGILPVREKVPMRERQRCSFKLPASEAYRLRRIAEAQPVTLKSLGIASVQIDNSGPISIIVSTSSLNFPEASYTTVLGATGSLTSSCSSNPSSTRCKRLLEATHKSENSEATASMESIPSTSCDLPTNKRRSGEFDSLHPATTPRGSGLTRIPSSEASAPGQPVISGNVAVRQQQSNNTNNNSPLLVNLLRSASPGAGASLNAQHSQVYSHRSTGSTSAQPVVTSGQSPPPGYSSYPPFMPRTPVSASTPSGPPSAQLRPSLTPNDMPQQTPGSSHMHGEAQQGNVERPRQMVPGATQGGQPAQLPQAYYSTMQYNQQPRPMLPHGYVLANDGHPTQQQRQPPVMYSQQSRQPARPQFMLTQQQSVPPGHSLPPQYHQQQPIEQEQPTTLQPAPPPTKKRKRPTKKQKEAELQAANAAQQQQQHYIMEQQRMASRMPANIHAVERPTIMPQVIQSGQGQGGMVYPGQQSRGYPTTNLQSPSAPSPAGHMQSSTTTHVYYQQQPQQQHMWAGQQQMMQSQRPGQMMQPQQQMMYSGQVQQQWQQPNQRVAYPQGENASEISSATGSVHTSPMGSRNASIDFSPASQSSSTMSPLYHQQQQPHMLYQQQSAQTPPSAVAYQQAPSQSLQSNSQQRNEQQLQQGSSISIQQHSYIQEQSQHLQNQHKNTLGDGNDDFAMQDLGANIADCGGDFNDLDSIEPMPHVSTTYQNTPHPSCHAQQPPTRGQLTRHSQQGGFTTDSQQHCAGQDYDPISIPSTSQADCYSRQHHSANSYTAQKPSGSIQQIATYQVQQRQQSQFHQQQRSQHQQYPQYQQPETQQMQQHHLRQRQRPGSYATQLPSTSQTNFVQQKSQSMATSAQNSIVQQQRTQSGGLSQTSSSNYGQSAPVTQGPHRTSVESSPLRQPVRCDETNSPIPEEEGGVGSSKSEISAMKEGDKDPINSTIESVLMRTRTDQDSNISQSNVSQNRVNAARSRAGHNLHPSSSADTFSTGHQLQQSQYGASGEVNQRSVNGQSTATSRPTNLMQQVPSVSGSVSRHSSTAAGDCTDANEKSALFNDEKGSRTDDCISSNSEQIINNTGYQSQRHLTNGHDLQHVKDYRFIQPPNGLSGTVLTADERKPLTAGQHAPVTQRMSGKSGGARRNRRKADLAQEASPQRDDEDEYYLPTSAAQGSRTPYTRLSIAGGKVVGSSSAPSGQPIYGSVQNAQNNFSATVARQQQKMMKSQPKPS